MDTPPPLGIFDLQWFKQDLARELMQLSPSPFLD